MPNLAWKMRISILWIFLAVAMSAHYVMYIFEPGGIQEIISEEMVLSSGLAMYETLINWLIPLSMAFLSVTLKDRSKTKTKFGFRGSFHYPRNNSLDDLSYPAYIR